MNAQPEATDAPHVCVACRASTLIEAEQVASSRLVEAWRREDELDGTPGLAEKRAKDLQETPPPQVRFDRCTDCGLEMAWPPAVWSAERYPQDQSYPIRCEFLKIIEALGPEPLDLLEVGCGTAAGSHIGMVRAEYRGLRDHWLGRRACIAYGWLRLLVAPEQRHGISLFVGATR